MPESYDEIRLDELSAADLQDLLGEMGQQLTAEQLKLLLQLVNSCEDLEQAFEALEHVDRAA